METSVKQRLVAYLKYKKIGQNRFERLASISNGYISNLRNAPKSEQLTKILQAAPDLNRVWLLTGEGEMLISDEGTSPMSDVPTRVMSEKEGRPYYNVDFKAGFDLMENDQTRNPEYYISWEPFNDCDCWINAHGNSMSPTIVSGDIVALKRIYDFSTLLSGEIYGIVTSNGLRTIKRIKDNGDTILLVPDNKELPEQEIPKDIITHVFQVRGRLTFF